jgi:hypothetical protein
MQHTFQEESLDHRIPERPFETQQMQLQSQRPQNYAKQRFAHS